MPATQCRLVISDLDAEKLYSLADFCKLCPSRTGGRLSIKQAHRWVSEGKLPATKVPMPGGRPLYFMTGQQIRDFFVLPAVESPAPASPSDATRRLNKSLDELAALNGTPDRKKSRPKPVAV